MITKDKITEAALFNRAKTDKYFYGGKIVNYGDMGGNNDHDFMEESKNLMKELQSDGFLNKPLNIPDGEGGWEVKDLELVGRPCLTYTTVPNHYFDDQEMSSYCFQYAIELVKIPFIERRVLKEVDDKVNIRIYHSRREIYFRTKCGR